MGSVVNYEFEVFLLEFWGIFRVGIRGERWLELFMVIIFDYGYLSRM